ncbi:MAG: DUF5103 domain-containing protein [Saprospirales bacterium]|nr:DUF5103 domain-containing protein [Saprospirales bacterium]MBK8490678.1 DUF5103 domain-containing protein [Saprospirales bacterium]
MDKPAKMKYFFRLLFLFMPLMVQGQVQPSDITYVDYIRSVRMYPNGVMLGYPIIELFSNAQLYISFDDLSDEVKNFTYTVVHCNANWEPSGLTENEYIDGFPEDRIDDFSFSGSTRTPFVHYYFAIPNRDMDFTKSGNYVLKVYEDEDEKTLVFTRRFMVVEQAMRIAPRMVRTSQVSKSDTHQEVDFIVTHKGIDIRNPLMEVKASVLQNGRWDNAITGVIPQFVRPEEMSFDYQNKIVFEAGKEFRSLDLRSFRYPSGDVAAIEMYSDGIDITLGKDLKRANQVYLEYNDLNGNYVIESTDMGDPVLEGDYARVLFSLDSPTEYEDSDVYILGALTEWQLKPEFKMAYNSRIHAYIGEALLKQGYYNYYYAMAPRTGGLPAIEDTEGNWYETENDYTILIYYRPFGERYDRLVAATTFQAWR